MTCHHQRVDQRAVKSPAAEVPNTTSAVEVLRVELQNKRNHPFVLSNAYPMTGARTQTAQGAPPAANMAEVHASLRPRQRSAERISQCRAPPPHKAQGGPSAGNGKLHLSAGSGKHCPTGDIHNKRDPPLLRSPPRTYSLKKLPRTAGEKTPGHLPDGSGVRGENKPLFVADSEDLDST